MPKNIISFRYIDPLRQVPRVRRVPQVSQGLKSSGGTRDTLLSRDTPKRDNTWLLARLDHLWTNYFLDVSQDNPLFIKFGRHSKFRLGSIRFDSRSKHSLITITSMFKDPSIPSAIVDHTIAHELCHYTHGFSSPKRQLHKYPHSGGVIIRELEERNLHHLVKAYKAWVKSYREKLRLRRLGD